MASAPWSEGERDLLRDLANRRDWIGDAMRMFPERTAAALRCMMQKVRADEGMGDTRFFENAWMADAINGSAKLLERLKETGLRP